MLENFKNLLLETALLPIFIGIALRINILFLYIIAFLICIALAFHIGSTYSEEIKLIKSWFYGIVKWRDRQKIAGECESKINIFSKEMSSELIGREPHKVKIQWVTGEEEDYFKSGNLIIRLRDSGNPNKNFITVAVRFISKTLIPETKQYLYKTLSKSIDFFTVKKLLDEKAKNLSPLFYEEYYYPETIKDPKIKNCFEYFKIIDGVGIFNRVFIQELLFLGKKAHFQFGPEDPKITKEVINLLNFLKDIVNKEAGEYAASGLTFIGDLLKSGIVLVAELEKRILGDPQPFVQRVNKELGRGIEDIYLISWGRNIPLLKIITHNYLDKDSRLEKIKEYNYSFGRRNTKALLVLYKNKQI